MTINPNFISVNYSPTRFGDRVRLIVLHTEQGHEAGTASWFHNPAAQASAHYGIYLAGETVDQFVAEGDTAWHAGVWSVNTGSIGIEHEDNVDPDHVVRTADQYNASARLVADICRRFGLVCDRSTVKKHNEVSNSHPSCPGNLDVDHIVALAQALLGAKQTATVQAASFVPGVTAIDETVTVNVESLNVRQGPGTQYTGFAANTKDGLVHDGDTVHVIGCVVAQVVNGNPYWLRTLNALGESHWIWAGGTNFTLPAPASLPEPVVAAPAPTPAPDPAPTPASEPVIVQPEQPVTPPVVEATVPTPDPARDLNPVSGTATLATIGYVYDLKTNTAIAEVPAGTVIPVAGTTTAYGQLFLVSKNMVDEHLDEGIPSTYFVRRVDSVGPRKVPVTLAQVPKGWHPILKLLNFLHLKKH